jgi:hypothetical protein
VRMTSIITTMHGEGGRWIGVAPPGPVNAIASDATA